MDKQKMSDIFHTGKKLNMARKLRARRLKDIAVAFSVQEDTILKWQSRGVPVKFLPTLAHYFDVDEWVFSNGGISEKEFQNIILNPKELGSMRPIFSFRGNQKDNKELRENNVFEINSNKILIRAFVWDVEGQTISQFILTIENYYGLKTLDRFCYPKPETLRVITDKNIKKSDKVMREMIVEDMKHGAYFFSVDAPSVFELFVYDIKRYMA